MRRIVSALSFGVVASLFAGPSIIFDTDMVSDYDDVGAVAVLHAAADAGQCGILAMGTCSGDNASVGVVEILNAYPHDPVRLD